MTLRRRPSLRATVGANVAALEAMGPMPDALRASLARMPLPKRRVRRASATDAETAGRPLEADVIRAVEQLLAVHPRVLWAVRMNSGAASYKTKSGKYAPVWFHRWVRGPGCRMSDFLGAVNIPHPNDRPIRLLWPTILAIECKRPGWTEPTDQREREQSAFLAIVRSHGGRAGFATSANEARRIIEG